MFGADSWTILELSLNLCRAMRGEGRAEKSRVSRPVWDLRGRGARTVLASSRAAVGGGRGSSAHAPGQVCPSSYPRCPIDRSATEAQPGAPQLCQVGVTPERAGGIPVGRLCPEEEEVQASSEVQPSAPDLPSKAAGGRQGLGSPPGGATEPGAGTLLVPPPRLLPAHLLSSILSPARPSF